MNWITVEPSWPVAVIWVAVLAVALGLTAQRSPVLSAIRLISHLLLYVLSAVVAWRVLLATRRATAGRS